MSAVWSDVIQTSGARLYWLIAGFCSTLLTARYLGPEGRGVYATAVTWVNLFAAVAYFSLPQVVMFFSAGRRKEEWLPPVAGTITVLVAASAAACWIVVFGLAAWLGDDAFGRVPVQALAVAFAAMPALLWIENGNSLLIALGELRTLNLSQIVNGTTNVVLVLLLVGVLSRGVLGALVALLLAQVAAGAISFRVVRRQAQQLRFEKATAARLLTSGARMQLNALGSFLVLQSGVLIVNHFRTSAETAYYHLALQLVAAMQVIPMAVSTVAYSIVARDGADAGWPEHRRLLARTIVGVALLSIVAYAVAPTAVRLLVGARFLPAADVFRTLLFGAVGMTMSVVMATQWISRGFFLRAALLSTVAGLATLGANWLIIPRYGMQGAAWVMVTLCGLSMLVNGGMIVWVERRWRRLR